MGGGSQTTDTSQQSVNTTQLPPWVNQAAQQNYALAQNVANRPLTQFQGQQVADTAPQTQQAWNLAATSGAAGADQYNASQAGYLGVLGSTPQQITAAQANLANPVTAATAGRGATAAPSQNVTAAQSGLSQLANTNLSSYMNPYTQSVINSTLPLYQQQLAQQMAGNNAQAVASNAFGGSRFGIQQGTTQAQGAMGMAQMAEQLNQANFAQAQQAAQYDVGQANQMGQFNTGQTNAANLQNQLQANAVNQFNANQLNQMGQFNAGQQNQVGLANMSAANQMAQFNAGAQNTAAYQNQQAGLTQEQLANAAAAGMGALGTQAQTNQRQQFLEQSTAGAQEQQQAQNQIQAQMNQFNQANAYPTTQLGILQSALGMTPYGSSTTGASSGQSTTQTNPSIASDIFGGLQSLGGMFGSGGPFSSLLTGSDRHLKTDISKVGVHQPTGLPMFSYRYKGDPKSYPKVIGPMAEDAMQVAPHAVKTIGIHQPSGQAMHGVDMNALAATPAIRPRRMPGANGMMTTRIPGALSPVAPTGVMGAMGANMRAPKMRGQGPRMPKIAGALGGMSG